MTVHVGSVGPPIRANTMEPEVLRQIIDTVCGGRLGIMNGSDLAVTQNGSPNMSVNVAAGKALVPGTFNSPVQGTYGVYNDGVGNLVISTANATNPRIDIVCMSIQDAFYSGASNTALLQVVTGAAAASPTVPAAPINSIVLAHIYVGAAVSSILTANINGTAGTNNPDTNAFSPLRCAGILNSVVGTGGTVTSTASPGAVIPGMQVTVNCQGGRNVRIRCVVGFLASTTLNNTGVLYRDGVGGVQLSDSFEFIDTASGGLYVLESIDQPAAGIHTYQANSWSSAANTQTYVAGRGRITVEDAGPI